MLTSKLELMRMLTHAEAAVALATQAGSFDHLDALYAAMKCKLTPLDKSSATYAQIASFVACNQEKQRQHLELLEVFAYVPPPPPTTTTTTTTTSTQ